MIKVTHIIGGLDTGGAEMMLYHLLRFMNRAEFVSEVISLTDIGAVGKRIQALDVPVRALGMHRGVPDPRYIFYLSRHLRRNRPDVVQSWMYHADLLGGIAAKMAGNIPIAWDIQHGTFDPKKDKRMTILTARACARLSSWLPARVVCCSEATRLTHISIGYMERKMVVIPNSIDLDIFYPHPLTKVSVRDELGLPADTLLIGLIARFSPEKDHATFVRAAGLFHIFFPDIHFLLCGEGVTWENQELADWIDAAGVRSHAHLLGRRDDIPRLTATLDIATLCSSSEAFGIVVCEAMACTVPCTVTNIGVLADIVGDTGRVVPPRDPQALAAAWQELIEMGAEKRAELGTRARQRVKERFSITAAAAQYEALYRELAHAGRNHRS